MTKLERIVLNSLPVRLMIRKSRKIILPGFQGMPLYDVVAFFINQVKKVGLNDRASSIAFHFLLAIPAGTIFICTLLPYIPVTRTIATQLLEQIAIEFTPDVKTFLMVQKFLTDFLITPRSNLLSIGFLFAVFSSSNAMMGIMRTFNKSLIRSTRRNFLESRWMAIKLTTLVIFLVIISMTLLITQGELLNRLLRWMNIHNPLMVSVIKSLRYVIIVAFIFYAIAFIYKYAPAVHKRWKLSSPGTILATLLIILTTFLFSFWLNRFANYNKIYGSIGTILIIMILTYINSLILLIGFELNVSIHFAKMIAEEKTKDETNASNS